MAGITSPLELRRSLLPRRQRPFGTSSYCYILATTVLLTSCATLQGALAFLPPQNPSWSPTYSLQRSLISMAANRSGWSNSTFFAQFGIISYDWSNAKAQWAAARPMDCEERLVAQAEDTQAKDPLVRPFVYRNLVKALPWFKTVREKLQDPAYSGWFLPFKKGGAFANGSYHVPACDADYTPLLCSGLYHDQQQTPEVPTPADPSPDGACVGTCDCGGVPCGEYLFDHRNASLREWLVKAHVGGPTGVDNPAIHGLFIDDFWCSEIINGTGACTDPVPGPSEIDRNSQADMGLSDEDVRDITLGWLSTMTAAQQYMVSRGTYTWSLMLGQDNANAQPLLITANNCQAVFEDVCALSVPGQTPFDLAPLLFGLTPGANKSDPFPLLDLEIAAFQLLRGPYAWLGYGEWGLTWPVGGTFDLAKDTWDIPHALRKDYGAPKGPCSQIAPTKFMRQYKKKTFYVNCATWPSNNAARTKV